MEAVKPRGMKICCMCLVIWERCVPSVGWIESNTLSEAITQGCVHFIFIFISCTHLLLNVACNLCSRNMPLHVYIYLYVCKWLLEECVYVEQWSFGCSTEVKSPSMKKDYFIFNLPFFLVLKISSCILIFALKFSTCGKSSTSHYGFMKLWSWAQIMNYSLWCSSACVRWAD